MANGTRTIKVSFDGDSGGLDRAASRGQKTIAKWAASADKSITTAGRVAAGAAKAAAVIIGAALTPALAGVLAAGILLAIGGGFLAAGIAGAVKDPKVAAAFGGLKSTASSVLAEFSKPFQGPLIRAAQTFSDALDSMRPALDTLAQQLAPIIDQLAPALAKMATNALPGITKAAGDSVPIFTAIAGILPSVGTFIGDVVSKLADLFTWVNNNSGAIINLIKIMAPIAGILFGISAATKAWTTWQNVAEKATKAWSAAQVVLDAVMDANPITLIVIAIIALIAIIVLIATKTQFFQTVWKAAWGGIKAAASAVGSWFKNTLWGSWIQGSFNAIVGAGKKVLSWFTGLPGQLGHALGSVASTISSPFRAAFNKISDLWNGSVGNLSFSVPSWVPGIGGKGFSLPRLPRLATGGFLAAGGSALVGENGPELITAGRGGFVHNATDTAAMMGPPEVRVFIGDRELTDIIRVEQSSHDRQLKRRTSARKPGVTVL